MSFNSSWWSVQLPSEWTITEDGQCATLSGKHFSSAFQISAARKERGLVTDEELKDFVSERLTNNVLSQIDTGLFSGFYAERSESGVFWREWWLCAGSLMIYASYNVDEKFKNAETSLINHIVESLKPK